jgi:hypothetical protein
LAVQRILLLDSRARNEAVGIAESLVSIPILSDLRSFSKAIQDSDGRNAAFEGSAFFEAGAFPRVERQAV